MPESNGLVHIPFHGDDLIAVNRNDRPLVALKRIADNLGLDWDTQRRKLSAAHWAWTVNMTAQLPGDSQSRETMFGDVRTVLMWLATINPAKVAPTIRPKLEAYQSEVADAIEAYFTRGAAVNPRILPERRYKLAAEILAIAPPAVSPTWVEQKYRHLVALSLGEEPEVAEEDRLLTVDEYLQDREIKGKQLRSMRTSFGTKLAAAYRKRHGASPKKAPRFVDGTTRPVSVYTERDRPLFDQVWEQFYAAEDAA